MINIFDEPNYTPLEFVVYAFRRYGHPKLSKPKELKGIRQTMSIDYIPKKCRCPIFINDNDVWVQHSVFIEILKSKDYKITKEF